ncbi:hypothetical protein PM082_006307 [Marasmius tenuissimus]|nr:hypothetical protein PM082_006307 [Marasmius tenuissimus]
MAYNMPTTPPSAMQNWRSSIDYSGRHAKPNINLPVADVTLFPPSGIHYAYTSTPYGPPPLPLEYSPPNTSASTVPDAIDSFFVNPDPNMTTTTLPVGVPINADVPSCSVPECRPLFTNIPLDRALLELALCFPVVATGSDNSRETTARPWHYTNKLLVERSLGISLFNVSVPNLEEKGCLYWYRIEKASPIPGVAYYKVGRTIHYSQQQQQWRRQCPSQHQSWFDPVYVDHCHQTERLVHLVLIRICLARPRDLCDDCLRKHQEIFLLPDIIEGCTVDKYLRSLVRKIDDLVKQSGCYET